MVFQKIEKLEYNFPSGFHPSGKSFISSLLRLKPQDRLGSNRVDSDIKNHIFFNKIAWANLYQQIAPPIKQYLPPSEDSSSLDGALEPNVINQAVDNQSPDNNRSAIDDASGQGIPFVLPKDEYDSLLKDQSVNRKNVAHKWKDFVENELIIKMGYMEKKRGFFPRKRMFLLTGKKRSKIFQAVKSEEVACPINQAVPNFFSFAGSSCPLIQNKERGRPEKTMKSTEW